MAYSRCLSRAPNSPRSKQAQERLLLVIQPGFPCAHDAKATRPEILERAATEILLDHQCPSRQYGHHFWPAITLRQSPPSSLPRLTALAADECELWLGARDP
jgi:hypothetical protein